MPAVPKRPINLSRWEFVYENTGVIIKGIQHWGTGDKMDATLFSLEILHCQIRKEINIPIVMSIFTQFILYDLM